MVTQQSSLYDVCVRFKAIGALTEAHCIEATQRIARQSRVPGCGRCILEMEARRLMARLLTT